MRAEEWTTPHRRRNPLTGEWVLVAAGRDARPWRGQTEARAAEPTLRHDPGCSLCPGNERTGGARNPAYDGTFVFTNDFPALRPDGELGAQTVDDPLFQAAPEAGTCRVLCFSPRHDNHLVDMAPAEVRRVVDLWCEQHAELAEDWAWVQVFENRGPAMGASNPHPHGQVWAGSTLPTYVVREDEHQRAHHRSHGSALLADCVARELERGERVVVDAEGWVAFVPFWAAWPFEVLLVPKRASVARFGDLTGGERSTLVTAIHALLAAYDGLFAAPFPYSMGWHPAPGRDPAPHWVLHAHYYPPLLRADARKWFVGYELLAEPQRDLTPETAARLLREAAAGT